LTPSYAHRFSAVNSGIPACLTGSLESTYETLSVKINPDYMAGKFRLLFGSFFRSVHQLWLEVIGALFIALAAVFAMSAFQEYRKLTISQGAGFWVVTTAAVLSVVTLCFGIHSFWKARKLR
jgi:hypothetical protein